MKNNLISWLFALVAARFLSKSLKTPIGAVLIPIALGIYLIWFFNMITS